MGTVEAAGAVVCTAALAAVCTGGTPSAGGSRLRGEGPADNWHAAPRLEWQEQLGGEPSPRAPEAVVAGLG